MANENTKSFMLNNSLAAVSALPLEEQILATDGFTPKIHIFERNGVFTDTAPTARAYRRLRCNPLNGNLTALACCNEARIYFIGTEYRELCYCDLKDMGNEITDASVTLREEGAFIVAANRKNAFLLEPDGRPCDTLCKAEQGEEITDFINPTPELFALATVKNGACTVSVTENGITHTAMLSGKISLRMLLHSGGIVYGLFGFGYIYNRIIPIYFGGRLILPDWNNFCGNA